MVVGLQLQKPPSRLTCWLSGGHTWRYNPARHEHHCLRCGSIKAA